MKDNLKNKWNISALILIFIILPVTIILGYRFLGDENFFLLSIILACLMIVGGFLLFEGRKPDARMIVIISVMTTLAILGRAIFFMLPNFKPSLAIVIITGVCLGKMPGFMTGAMTAFISNFIFGQGPWTPWQMLAMGIVGLLAGMLFEREGQGYLAYDVDDKLKIKRLALLAVFGALSTFIIYGGMVDLWTLFGLFGKPTLANILVVYGSGAIFNLIHTASTVVFLLILSIPISEKLERSKIKYGFIR